MSHIFQRCDKHSNTSQVNLLSDRKNENMENSEGTEYIVVILLSTS